MESAWHLNWKAVHMALGGAWLIEHPVVINGQRFFLDAYNPETQQIREFVHSLSPHYVAKHRAIYPYARMTHWIFDGAAFISKRAHFWQSRNGGGMRDFLKPNAYAIARHLPSILHADCIYRAQYDAMQLRYIQNGLEPPARMPCVLHGRACHEVFWREWRNKQSNIWFPLDPKDSAQQLLGLYRAMAGTAETP